MYDENQTFVLIDNCLKRSKFEPNAPSFKIDAKFFQASKSNWRKLIFFLANVECIKMENYFQPILKLDEIAAGFAFQVEEINFH